MRKKVNNLLPFEFKYILQPVDGSTLYLFRILIGTLLVIRILSYLKSNKLNNSYLEPDFFFKYPLFSWVQVPPGPILYGIFYVLLISALGILLGYWYRLNCAVFFSTYLYVFLMEFTYYQNVDYIIILIVFLLFFLPAHRQFAFDSTTANIRSVPRGGIWLLRFQFFVIMFYGGLAKLNWDWLRGQPIAIWLVHEANVPYREILFGTFPEIILVVAYSVLAFELLAIPLYIWKKTRRLAVISFLVFIILVELTLSVGMITYFTIALIVTLFPPSWPRQTGLIPKTDLTEKNFNHTEYKINVYSVACGLFIGVYILSQIFLPLRPYLIYSGYDCWNRYGDKFSWHMRLNAWSPKLRYYVKEKNNKNWTTVSRIFLDKHLSKRQQNVFPIYPRLVVQLGKFIENHYRQKRDFVNPVVAVRSKIKFNGRPFQFHLEEGLFVSRLDVPWSVPVWVESLKGSAPHYRDYLRKQGIL